MMNLLEVQDDLKNFSQDQLVKEMQQPSGVAPQFLVLSELNRRKRVKGDFEARQAQQQPTVAEEAVAAAGVPQQGMMGMSEAMAPESVESGGIGSMMPKTMKMGGEVDSYAEGGLIEGIADSVSQNSEALQGIQEATMQNSKLLQDQQNQSAQQPQIPTPMPIQQLPGFTDRGPFPRIPRPRFPGFGGKGGAMARPAVIDRPRFGSMGFGGSTMNPRLRGLGGYRGTLGSGLAALGNRMPEPQSMAEGGVIRAQDGLSKNPYRPFDEFPEYPEGYEYTPEDTRLERIAKGTSQVLHDVKPYLPFSPEFMKVIGNDLSQFFNEPVGLAEQEKEESEDAENMDQALNDAVIQQKQKDPAPQPKLNLTSKDSPLSIEQELLKRQADLSKSKDFDKYMALAQAGLSIMGSTKPTLAGAIGEGGTAGLKAFNEARKRYDEGLTDILNARAKLQQAKITAAGKGRLTRSGALTAISSYNNAITAIRKEIADIYQKNPAADQDSAVMSQINDLKNQIIGLETEKSQLYNTAQIRPRSSILVKDLPSSQKES